MARAFVLGNGLSRQGLDLARLKQLGKIYGCNALYRDYTPDVLVATDRPISEHIQQSGYSAQHDFYTRRPLEGKGAKQLIKKYYGYSSGPNAVALAANHQHASVYLLGFDMGPVGNNFFNNVYADTEFYKKSSQPATFAGNWVKQICQICQDYSATEFIRVCGTTTAKISDFDSLNNFKHMSMQDFTDSMNLQQ